MKQFPAFFPLDGRKVVIAGGGALAARKARLVWGERVDLLIVAPSIDAQVRVEWAGPARLEEREPVAGDFEGAALAIVAEEDEARAQSWAVLARASGVPLNVVDQPELSDFFTPSIVDRGDVVAAISTGGMAPVYGRRIRAKMEEFLPEGAGQLAGFANQYRGAVAATIAPAGRRSFWERFFDGPVAARFLAGDRSGAHEAMIALINTPEHVSERSGEAGEAGEGPQGIVHLVGAGPGDPDLLTIRAHRLLQAADVIVYDRLVGHGILALARRDADRIYVGKAKSNHAVPQEEIGRLLVSLARAGKIVVRLKGGDPFVFGRGGEELDEARAAGIEVTITPGITAAIGCAASASMPLTHRDHSQAVTFVTGHAKGDTDPDIDWQALARLGHTLVVYMGIGKANVISSRLIAAGQDGATPAAIIENGTRANERVIKGTLADLGRSVARHGIKGPALLVIGAVAALASEKDLGAIAEDALVVERRTA